MPTKSPTTKKTKPPSVCYTDPINPPPLGPYGTLKWDAKAPGAGRSKGRWKYKLNPRGARMAAKWLAKHRTPTRMARRIPMLRTTFYSLLHLGVDLCDVEGELMIALTEGIARWVPERGGMSTIIAWQMKKALSSMMRLHQAKLAERQFSCEDGTGMDGFFGAPDVVDPKSLEESRHFDDAQLPADVLKAMRNISCDRTRQIFLRRFREGEKLEKIGLAVGLTKERVRQLAAFGMHRVQASLGYPNAEYNESKSEYTIPARKIFTPTEQDAAIAMTKAGKSSTQIAWELRVPAEAVKNLLYRLRCNGVIPKARVGRKPS